MGPVTFQCLVGNNAGDVVGLAACGAYPAASTVTIAGTRALRRASTVVQLGHASGSAPAVASVAWGYALLRGSESPRVRVSDTDSDVL